MLPLFTGRLASGRRALASRAGPVIKCRREVGRSELQSRVGEVSRRYALESKSPSQEGGFQSSSPWRQSQAASGSRNVDLSLTWQQYAGSLVEFGLMFVCLGFAFAASLRASHHQTVHDEEIEALNYELIESEEEMERVKENWRRMEIALKEGARKQAGSAELMIPLSQVTEMAKAQVFISKTEYERQMEERKKKAMSQEEETAQMQAAAALLVPTKPLTTGPIPLIPSSPNSRIIMY